MSKNNIELIRQALGAAESSIKLAKQLLNELENAGIDAKPKAKELPGITGIFDGENMVSETGDTFPVPANYASKSLLVVGDTLKLVEEGNEKRFKQIEHVKRHRTTGIIAKKDGKWKAVTPEGSYKVLPAAVAHFGADVGSEVVLHLPANNLTVPYGAIESVKGKEKTKTEVNDSKPEVKVEENQSVPTEKPKEASKPVVKKDPTVAPTKKPEPIKEVKKPEPPKPIVNIPKEPIKEKVINNPQPLKVVTIEPEPKPVSVTVVEEKKPEVVKTQTPTPEKIEILPEEDELA